MKIDWKHLATTFGYKSLKQAVVENFSKLKYRNKKESYKLFRYVINRAQHYAHVQGLPVEEILTLWEEARGQRWILAVYPGDRHSNNYPRLDPKSPTVKPTKPKNYYKKNSWISQDPANKKKRSLEAIMRQQKLNSKRKGKKARWPKQRKEWQRKQKEFVS